MMVINELALQSEASWSLSDYQRSSLSFLFEGGKHDPRKEDTFMREREGTVAGFERVVVEV